MRKEKLCACLLLIGCVLLTGCGNTSTAGTTENAMVTDSETETGKQNANEENSEAIVGRIQSVEGSTITLAVMNMPENSKKGGEQPQKPDGEMPNGEQPQKPDGEMPNGEQPQKPDGEMPDGEQPQKPNGDMPGGETATQSINVTAETIISDASGNAITLEELTESTMITVELDSDGNAISITISDMPQMGEPGEKSQGASSSYDALFHYTEDTTVFSEAISSTRTDEF